MTTSFKRGGWALCLAMLAIPAAAHNGPPNRVIVTGHASSGIAVPLLADASSGRMRIGLTLLAPDSAEPADAPLPEPASLGYPASSNAVLCHSDDQGYRECRTPFQGRVSLSREVGATRCIEHRNWGWHDGAVWVDQGCGAVFVRVSSK